MSRDLPPRLDARAIEPPLYREWLERGWFHVPASTVLEDGRDPYVIVIPPPNVTAVLHMGHGLNNTIQDVLIRWRRMQGRAQFTEAQVMQAFQRADLDRDGLPRDSSPRLRPRLRPRCRHCCRHFAAAHAARW